MKITPKLFASLLTLLAACLVQAADSKTIARVISVQDVETDDPTGYNTWIGKMNEVAKAKLGIDNVYHVFVSTFDGERTASVRTVVSAESVAALTKIAAALENDPAIEENRAHLRGIRKFGARVLYQAVRFDGLTKNSYLFNTLAVVSDEAGYLKALDGLRTILDNGGFQDAKINAYRVLAGRSNHTHRIGISSPNPERFAALLDFLATDSQTAEWLASTAKYRTVVSNSTIHEITK
jgi:hypothetical protein